MWVWIILLAVIAVAYYAIVILPASQPVDHSKFKKQSFEIENKNKGESNIRRHPVSKDKLCSLAYDDVTTLYENFQRGVKKYGNNKCLGSRKNGGPFVWSTYKEVNERITDFGSGLINLGAKKGSFIGIYSINREEWVITEQACNAYSLVVVPLYDTLGPKAVEYIINQSELEIVVVTKDKVKLVTELLGKCKSIKHIVQMDGKVEDNCGGIVLSFEQVEKNGKQNRKEHDPPAPDDLATLCYTSGTTGNPKGAKLSHRNFIAASSGAKYQGLALKDNDVHISYLPLAHVFERIIQCILFVEGARVGFFRGNIRQLFDDILELKPTIFPSVPRLYNKLYDKVNAAINQGGVIKKLLFSIGYAEKEKLLRKGILKHWFWDKILFSRIRNRLGGRVRVMVTGSAPISGKVMDFLRICFSCEVIEGYGQTEGAAGGTTTVVGDTTSGHIGRPVPSVEIKLVDIPAMKYSTSDKPNPRGEIVLRGPSLFDGYYKLPERTNSTIINGWVHTGDVGEFLPNGTIRIIDRKKNIFKLSQGEYVAPEKIENVYARVPYIAQVFVYGDSMKSFLVGIVVPDEEVVIPYCKKNGITGDNLKQLCQSTALKKLIFDAMINLGKKSGLKGFEQVKDIYLSSELFSVENNLLTPTFKLKRPQALEFYQEKIDKMYESID